MKKILLGFLILSAFISPSLSQSDPIRFGIETDGRVLPTGIDPGTKAPLFITTDQYGNELSLKDLSEKGPVVVFFYRGQWCPVCSRYIRNLQDSLSYITDMGVSVVAVAPETAENVQITIDKTGTEVLVISDSDESIMKSFDVLFKVTEQYQDRIRSGRIATDIAENNGKETANLPVPATFIIDSNGIITARHFDYNYRNRASVHWILSNLPE
jgi:peroxiredoxin